MSNNIQQKVVLGCVLVRAITRLLRPVTALTERENFYVIVGSSAASALLVLGQRRSRDRGAYVRARRSSHAPVHRISGVGCLGGRAHLFPDRVREPILRHAAMGTGVSDQTSAGARLSGTRTSRRGSIGRFSQNERGRE